MDNRKFITIAEDNEVKTIHYEPFDKKDGLNKTEGELLQYGYLVNDIPNMPIKNGQITKMYYNPITNMFSFQYFDRPKTQEEIMTELQSQNAQVLLALVKGGLI